jgi:hypothetical protein
MERQKTRIHLPSLPVDRQGMPHRCLDTEPVQCRPENAVIVQPIDQDLVERCLLGLNTIHYALQTERDVTLDQMVLTSYAMPCKQRKTMMD